MNAAGDPEAKHCMRYAIRTGEGCSSGAGVYESALMGEAFTSGSMQPEILGE